MQVTPLPAATTPQPKQAKKALTVLYYIDGKNNLSPMAKHSFNSLDQVGSDDNVNVVAELGLMKQDVVRGLVSQGASTASFETLGKTDMGSPQSIQEFVEWGMKNYPAEKTILVLWNHGAGFKGICSDDEAKSICQNKDLAGALEQAQQNTGQKLSVINFNACLMNQAEVAYEYRNVAHYMVGSEEVEAGLRIPIPGLFGTTPQHKVIMDAQEAYKGGMKLSDEDLANLFVYEAKNQFGTSMFTPTQAAIDLSQAEPLKNSCDDFAGKMLSAMQADPKLVDTLRKDIKQAQHYANIEAHIEPYVDYRDLGDFAKVIAKNDAYPADVRQAAENIKQAMGNAVVSEHHAVTNGMVGRSMEGSTGLSAYLPTDYGFDRQGHSPVEGLPVGGTHGYETTSWAGGAGKSNWENMLKTIAKDDDLFGRHPKLARSMMSFGQISRFYGYQYALDAACGATSAAGLNWFPLMSFPYMFPVPGVIACAAGAVGAALRTQSGISKIAEGIRRDDSPAANRRHLVVDGAIDTAIGVGSLVTCGAMLTGTMNPGLQVVAQGVLALAVGRMAVNTGKALYNMHENRNKTVDQKLADARTYKPALPAAQTPPTPPPAPAAPAQPAPAAPAQQQAQAPAQQAA